MRVQYCTKPYFHASVGTVQYVFFIVFLKTIPTIKFCFKIKMTSINILIAFSIFSVSECFQLQHFRNSVTVCHASISMDVDVDSLGLTPKLRSYVQSFRDVPDEKLRYQQLLYLASKCDILSDEFKIPENKVPGCLSTVYVHGSTSDGKIYFKGDSDAQLTKGLVALLVNGLSGYTADEITKVNPEFIQYAGLSKSLTPGRNNGFLNMLAVMKSKAKKLNEELNPSEPKIILSYSSDGPTMSSIRTKLNRLKPSSLHIQNDSSKHANHIGMMGNSSTETHFTVSIVAECFKGLSLVQRHQLIYTLLGEELRGGVHALSIQAKTPDELLS